MYTYIHIYISIYLHRYALHGRGTPLACPTRTRRAPETPHPQFGVFISSSSLVLSSLELRDTKVYEPETLALLGVYQRYMM